MKQLSGLDASFLYMETGKQFGHVSSLSIYARPENDPDYDPLAMWRAQIERRLHLLEPLRRRHRSAWRSRRYRGVIRPGRWRAAP